MRQLDTNIVIAHLNGNADVGKRLHASLPDVAISTIVLGELFFGAALSRRRDENLEKLAHFLRVVPTFAFDEACAAAYGTIKCDLRSKGRPTGEVDLLIGAVAVAHGSKLVTHNTPDFENIAGLELEDWLA